MQVRFRDPDAVPRHAVFELELTAAHDAPPADAQLDVAFTDPSGVRRVVPAFWNGGREWRVRYSSGVEGAHAYRVLENELGVGEVAGALTVVPSGGENALLAHGAPTLSQDGMRLAHADGTPFLWLADTWWSAMTQRFRWPDTFQTLADDRAAKGFNVVQLVAGLVPEFEPFSERMASEGGQPWLDGGRGSINPAYFEVPDEKIDYLVAKGIVPCIVGGWAFYGRYLGRENVLRHWRHLVARYGAYPVVWCVAGEINVVGVWEHIAKGIAPTPPTLEDAHADVKAAELAEQIATWEEASRRVREIDPFARLRTVHPLGSSSDAFRDRTTFELDMLQTGHTGWHSVPTTAVRLRESLERGDKPALIAECSYEGIFDGSWHDVQRFFFWSCMLSGAAGHTYGTMAISTFNSKADPYRPLSRVCMNYWEDAIDWLGSAHVGVGKRILERLPFWDLTPCPDRVTPHAGPDDWRLHYAASASDGTVVIYQPSTAMTSDGSWQRFRALTVEGLTPGAAYTIDYVNPRSGETDASERFEATVDGRYEDVAKHFWRTPTGEDWVLVMRPA